jgi:hypothetical protein
MLMHHSLSSLAALGLSAVLLGCSTASGNGGATTSASPSTPAAPAVQTQEWRNLIDPTLTAWRG